MYELAILTTAIIRPDLHSISLNSLKHIIPTDLKIYWIINIDFVNTLPKIVNKSQLTNDYKKKCLNITEKNIRNIFKNYDNISFKFIKRENGSFNFAVRTILNEYLKIKEDITNGILYLEDDWIVLKAANIRDMFVHLKTKNILGVSLRNNKRIGFKPCLWNLDYFNEIFVESFNKNNKLNLDPEQLVRTTNKYGFKKDDLEKYSKEILVTDKIFFEDIGIPWRNKRRMIKWDWSNCHTTYL